MRDFSFRFNREASGVLRMLGDLEADIMRAVWRRGAATVRDVHDALQENRRGAYTTVMTVMGRLHEKGLLSRTKSGNAYVYTATVTEDDLTRSAVERIVDVLLDEFSTPALRQFIDRVDREDPEKLEELARLIERKRRST